MHHKLWIEFLSIWQTVSFSESTLLPIVITDTQTKLLPLLLTADICCFTSQTDRQRNVKRCNKNRIKQTAWTWLMTGRPRVCGSIPSYSRRRQEVFRFSTGSRPALLLFFQLRTRHPMVKWSGHEAEHPPLLRVQIKVWSFPSTPPPHYKFISWSLIKHRVNFAFFF